MLFVKYNYLFVGVCLAVEQIIYRGIQVPSIEPKGERANGDAQQGALLACGR